MDLLLPSAANKLSLLVISVDFIVLQYCNLKGAIISGISEASSVAGDCASAALVILRPNNNIERYILADHTGITLVITKLTPIKSLGVTMHPQHQV